MSDVTKTDTPRTDAVAGDGWSGDAICVPADFARELERENARLREEVEALRNEIGRITSKGTGVDGLDTEA